MFAGAETAEAGLFAQMTPALLALADTGRVAVSLGGSRAKSFADTKSDYDFRVYADQFKGPELAETPAWAEFEAVWRSWERKGLRIDGAWCRSIASIDRDLAAWLDGHGAVKEYEWTIWGYHLPTDIAHQQIVADPDGVLGAWKDRLKTYPETLRRAVLDKHMSILRYWRADYHYLSKVERGDVVFLAGLSAKLLHSIMQVIFALNRTYFVGDGWNLRGTANFAIVPEDLANRVVRVVDPGPGRWAAQRERLIALVNDVEGLVARHAA